MTVVLSIHSAATGFIFYKKHTSRARAENSLNSRLFSIVTGNNRAEESIVSYKKS